MSPGAQDNAGEMGVGERSLIQRMRAGLGRAIGRGVLWLVLGLALREFRQRYHGSLLGPLWPLLYTCVMVSIYGFVFSVLLKIKWEQAGITDTSGNPAPFWVVLLAGQMLYYFLAEALSKSPTLVVGVPNYVKKVIFPLEVLPIVALLVEFVTLGINFAVLLLVGALFVGVSWHVALAPFIMLSLSFWWLGISWLLCGVGVFFRDLQQIMPLFSQILLFATPIFYPESIIPAQFRFVVTCNPLAAHVGALRDVMLWHRLPVAWEPLLVTSVLGMIFAYCGYRIFQKLRPSFADVL